MAVHRGPARLRRHPLVARIASAAARCGLSLHLTGGFLRDLALALPPKGELDLVTEDPPRLLGAFALEKGESCFLLDGERDTFRIVIRRPAPFSLIDVTRLRGASLAEDLHLRDFTVNALAFDLLPGSALALIDPTGGMSDMAERLLRPCSPQFMTDDPLRALRGVRLAANRNLRLAPETKRAISRARGTLRGVAGERIRDELFQVLQGPAAVRGTGLLLGLGLLETVAPSLGGGNGRGLTGLRRLDAFLSALAVRSRLHRRLREPLEQGVERRGITALTALLLDRKGRSDGGAVLERLALGAKAAVLLRTLLDEPLSPRWLDDPGAADREETRRLFLRCDDSVEEAAVLQAALHLSPDRGPAAVEGFLRRYRPARRLFSQPPLLSGRLAIAELGVQPGPPLGALLARAKRAQDLGAFRDREGALLWARRNLRERKDEAAPSD